MKTIRRIILTMILITAALIPTAAEPYTGAKAALGAQLEEYGGCKALRAGAEVGLHAGIGTGIHEIYGILEGSVSFPVKQWRSFTSQTWGWDASLGIGYGIRFANFRIGVGAGYMLQMFVSDNSVWSSGLFAELEPSLAISQAGGGLLSVVLPVKYVYSKTSPSLRVSAGVRFSFGGSNESSWI